MIFITDAVPLLKRVRYNTVADYTIGFIFRNVIAGFKSKPGLIAKSPAKNPHIAPIPMHFLIFYYVQMKSPFTNL